MDSGEHVGSETRPTVWISAEGCWWIVLDQSSGAWRVTLNLAVLCRLLGHIYVFRSKLSFLVC